MPKPDEIEGAVDNLLAEQPARGGQDAYQALADLINEWQGVDQPVSGEMVQALMVTLSASPDVYRAFLTRLNRDRLSHRREMNRRD